MSIITSFPHSRARIYVCTRWQFLTAAERFGASGPGVGAQDEVSVFNGSVAVGARVVRAIRLAALGNLADSAIAQHVRRVVDRGVAVGALDGVADRLELLNPCGKRRQKRRNGIG